MPYNDIYNFWSYNILHRVKDKNKKEENFEWKITRSSSYNTYSTVYVSVYHTQKNAKSITKFKKHEIEETFCDSASLETKEKRKKNLSKEKRRLTHTNVPTFEFKGNWSNEIATACLSSSEATFNRFASVNVRRVGLHPSRTRV